jgi:hypothetical protein
MPRSKRSSRTITRWLVMTASAGLLAITITILGAAPSFAAGTYSTTASVNVRSGPGTGYQVIGSEPGGAQFTLQCQWQGGTNIGGNATWDDVTFANGLTGAITDYYTNTPSFNSFAPGTGACGSSSPPPQGSGSLGGVDMQRACDTQYLGRGLKAVATNAGSAYSWQCTGPGVALGIDVTAECRTQYGYGAISAVSDPNSAWSWYCHWNITSQMETAANWASSQAGSTYSSYFRHYWSGWCEQFAEQAEGFHFTYGSAYLDYQAEANAGRIHADASPPAGALVFYGGSNGAGHVAVSIGNGQEIGTYGFVGQTYPIRQYPVTGFLTNPYLGWAIPFGS